MRIAAATTVLAGSCLLAGAAGAQTVPIPTVPTVTVPAVTVPPPPVAVPAPPVAVPTPPKPAPAPPPAVPVPNIPGVPSPAVPPPSSGQASPSTTAVTSVPTVSTASSVAGSALGGRSTFGAGSASSPSSASAAPATDAPKVKPLRSSRRWIATSGPKGRRITTLTFALPHAARVVFVVKQVSPVCRIAGHFAVNGHSGRNQVRFPGRASKLQLDPGTYRLTARTRSGRVIQRVTIVVVDGSTPTRDQIMAARASNVCTTDGRLAAATGSTGASNTGDVSSSPAQRSLTPGQPSATSEGGSGHSGAVLASSVEKAARVVRPVLVALLALSILLLAVASLPRLAGVADSRANELLARHRMEIAGLGTAGFLAVVIAFLLG